MTSLLAIGCLLMTYITHSYEIWLKDWKLYTIALGLELGLLLITMVSLGLEVWELTND